ncbi:MAG: hypothetical protein QOJ68_2101 [Blastococcus sp.]|nr:hypothetical protein [Blastococcus sp.]
MVVPALRETLDSYLGRLAAANRCDHEALRAHIAGDIRRTARITADGLATASGQPAALLLRAIPELSRAPTQFGNRPSQPYGSPRSECRHCALARGRIRAATVHAHHHEAVCRQHLRWLGDAHADSDGGQPDLGRHPQIVQTNLRHRRLIRIRGLDAATTAYRDAAWVCERWHEHQVHDHGFIDRLKLFHGPSWNLATTDATIQAARYPQIVALAALLASPHWRAKADQDQQAEFAEQVRRTVAPRYEWSLRSPHRRYDPLVQALGHHLRPVTHISTQDLRSKRSANSECR